MDSTTRPNEERYLGMAIDLGVESRQLSGTRVGVTLARIVGALLAAALVSYFSEVSALSKLASAKIGFRVAYVFPELKWIAAAAVLAVWAMILLLYRPLQVASIALRPFEILLLALFSLAAVSLLEAPDLYESSLVVFHATIVIGFYFCARLTVSNASIAALQSFSIVAIFASVGMSLLPNWLPAQNGFGNENFAAEFITVATLLSLVFWRTGSQQWAWLSKLSAVLGLTFIIFVSPAYLQYLGLLAAFLYWMVYHFDRRRRLTILSLIALSIVLGVVASVWHEDLVPYLETGKIERLQIWANTVVMIGSSPFFGRGIGSFFHDYGGFINAYLDVLPGLGQPAYDNYARQPSTPDNDLLHLTAELGILGASIAIFYFLAVFRHLLSKGTPQNIALLGVPLASLLALSLVSQTLQSPGTLIVAAILFAAITASSWPVKSPSDLKSSNAARVSLLASIMAISTLVGLFSVSDFRAAYKFAVAEGFDVAGQPGEAATQVREALKSSKRNPRHRLRYYPQMLIAGQYSQGSIDDSNEIEESYELARSASPQNPLLIDLRLKQLLTSGGKNVDLVEIEGLLASLKRTTGQTNANAHILEAALALQLNDTGRAEIALAKAHDLIRFPLNKNDEANLANYNALTGKLTSTVAPNAPE